MNKYTICFSIFGSVTVEAENADAARDRFDEIPGNVLVDLSNENIDTNEIDIHAIYLNDENGNIIF